AIPAAAVAAAVGLASAPAQANHAWGNYHWARSGEAHLTIHSSLTGGWAGNLTTANADWNRSPYLQNTVVASSTSTATRRTCPMPSGAIRVCNFAYGANG